MTTMLPIAETFDSIQGEGSLLGTPGFFIGDRRFEGAYTEEIEAIISDMLKN